MRTPTAVTTTVGLLASLAFTAAAPQWPETDPTGWEPSVEIPTGRTLVTIGQGDPSIYHDYVEAMGRGAAGAMSYVRLHADPEALREDLAELSAFATDERAEGTVLDIGLTMGPSPVWDTLAGNPAPPGAVDVVNGAYDEQLDILAAWLDGLPTAAFLRIGYEFDLLGGQWGPPEQYAAGFRYIVDAFREHGVDNAAYVWHSSGAYFRAFDYSGPAGVIGGADRADAAGAVVAALADTRDPVTGSDLLPIEAFYPGDGYVDYFGISYWDDACCSGRGTSSWRAVYRQRTRELLDQARAMGLPLTIGEATPAYIGASSGAESVTYFRRLFDLVEEYDIRMVNLISQDWQAKEMWRQPHWNGFWPDSRVHAYADVCELWVQRTSADRYVHGRYRAPDARPCATASTP